MSRSCWGRRDAFAACLVFAIAWTAYILAPITWIYDSHHTLLVSEQIYRHGNLQLDQYYQELEPRNEAGDAWAREPSDYRLHWVNGHLFDFYPPGSSILCVPFVPVFHLFGHSPIGMDGRHSLEEETFLQTQLAAVLTSLFVVLVFAMARRVLPLRWSVFTAVAMAFGTAALSITSRGLWSHTWGIFLLGTAVAICWKRMDQGWTPLAAAGVATLVSWCFLVRPTFALPAAGICLFAALRRARNWWLLPLVGLAWLGVFATFFWIHRGTWLPAYFLNPLTFSTMPEALAGNLVSPSRGLLVHTPGLLCWAYFAAAYFRYLPHRRWLVLSVGVTIAHWLVTSTNPNWWGGHTFGPRLMTDVLPWLAVAGILATRAWLDGQQSPWRRRIELAALVLLWGASAAIHSPGAYSVRAQQWNPHPVNVDMHSERVWDWTDAQFMRPLRTTPPRICVARDLTAEGGYGALVRRLAAGGTLRGDVHEIPTETGGTQRLTLNAGPAQGNRLYWIFGSITGTTPGVTLASRTGSVNIPLNPDLWTDYTIALANTVTLTNTKGTLDASGQAQADFTIPEVILPDVAGLIFYHAYLVYDADDNYYMASNPVPLRLK